MVTAADLAKKIPGAHRRANSEWHDARCPAHDDRSASLSFRDGDRGVIVKCHAGCPINAIAAHLGVPVSALFYANDAAPRSRATISATYDYVDERGEPLFQVVRYEPKAFRQRKPDGRGGWTWNGNGVRRVPYRLRNV